MSCVFMSEGRVLPYVQCVYVRRQSLVLCPVLCQKARSCPMSNLFMLKGRVLFYVLCVYVRRQSLALCPVLCQKAILPYALCVCVRGHGPALCPVCFMLEGMTLPYALWGYVSYLGLDD